MLSLSVPCIFPYSITSNLSLTFPVSEGDQCLLIFSQRSIDNWHKLGGIQDPVEDKYPRAHSLSDAIAILGLIPKSEAIKNFSFEHYRDKKQMSVGSHCS